MCCHCAATEIEEIEGGGEAAGSKEDGAGGDEAAAGRALQLQLVHKPQDGSADATMSLALSSSYIVYSAAALQRLQAFFHTEQVQLLIV